MVSHFLVSCNVLLGVHLTWVLFFGGKPKLKSPWSGFTFASAIYPWSYLSLELVFHPLNLWFSSLGDYKFNPINRLEISNSHKLFPQINSKDRLSCAPGAGLWGGGRFFRTLFHWGCGPRKLPLPQVSQSQSFPPTQQALPLVL